MITDKLTHSQLHCIKNKTNCIDFTTLCIINLDLNVCLQPYSYQCVGVFIIREENQLKLYKQD